jgi:hypothetical protein
MHFNFAVGDLRFNFALNGESQSKNKRDSKSEKSDKDSRRKNNESPRDEQPIDVIIA